MKRLFIFMAVALLYLASANAQSIKETFDSNSLKWNECVTESDFGTSIIDKGVLTITSKGESKFWAAMAGREAWGSYFTCFCYAPLNIKRSFKINTNVTIGKLDDDKLVGLIFNYKDK